MGSSLALSRKQRKLNMKVMETEVNRGIERRHHSVDPCC